MPTMYAKTALLWFKGLLAAAISAAANAVILRAVDPVVFDDWELLGKVAGVSALVAVAMYLKASPLPGNGEK